MRKFIAKRQTLFNVVSCNSSPSIRNHLSIRLNARSEFAEEDKMEETKISTSTGKDGKCLALRDHSKNTEDLLHLSFLSATTHAIRLGDNYKALTNGISSS